MKEIYFELKLFCLPIVSFKISTFNNIESNLKAEKQEVFENTTKNLEVSKITLNNNSNVLGSGNIRPDLKELEKEFINIEKVPEPIKVKCTSCDGTTYDDDLDFCFRCGKEICSNCGSIDIDHKKYCSNCWVNL